MVKSTSIDPSVIGPDNIFHHVGPARVFVSEEAAIHAIKNGEIRENDVMVLVCGGPAGAGMEEIYQITSALKWLPVGKHVALLTDARFSGVSTGACIGHISPEALAGGAIGKLFDGDQIEIIIDRQKLTGSVNLVGDAHHTFGAEEGSSQIGSASTPRRSAATSRAPRRHPAVGRAGPCQWRSLGRMRLRRRRHRLPAAAPLGTDSCLNCVLRRNGFIRLPVRPIPLAGEDDDPHINHHPRCGIHRNH